MLMKSPLPMLLRAGKRCEEDNTKLLLEKPIDQTRTNPKGRCPI